MHAIKAFSFAQTSMKLSIESQSLESSKNK